MSDDRTLPPSPKKIRDARQQGMVASSAELTASVGVLAAVVTLGAVGPGMADAIAELVSGATGKGGAELVRANPGAFVDHIRGAVGSVAGPMLAVLVAPALASMLTHQIQVGGLFVPMLVMPKAERLRPGSRGGGMADRLGRASGVVLRAVVLVTVAWWSIRSVVFAFDGLPSDMTPASFVAEASGAIRHALLQLGFALMAVGLIDFGLQIRRINARLRMSPEEQREERREQDGNPTTRSRQRASRVGLSPSPAGVEAIGPRAGSLG